MSCPSASSRRPSSVSATTTVTIQGYSHLAIVATDVDEVRRFYCDLLGFEELPRPDFGIPGVWLRVGDLQLHVIALEDRRARHLGSAPLRPPRSHRGVPRD